MKVKFEFDTESENFDKTELECFYQANTMSLCIYEITNKLRNWYKYDTRGEIPVSEVCDEILEIIKANVNLERMGY